MRVGIVINPSDPTIGGRYSFQNSVLEGLRSVATRHDIFLLVNNGRMSEVGPVSTCTVVDLQGRFGADAVSRQTGNRMPLSVRLLKSAGLNRAAASWLTLLQADEKPPTVLSPLAKAVEELRLEVVWFADPEGEVVTVPYFATVWDLEHRKQPYFPEVTSTGWDWNSREQHYTGLLPRAARIFTGTQTGRDEVIHYYGVNPANVVVNPFVVPGTAAAPASPDDIEVLERYGVPPGFLLYPAQFWPHKNHVNLLHGLKALQVEHGLTPPLLLTGADKGNVCHVRATIDALGLADRVHLPGFVPAHDLEAFYRQAALLVFPTFFGPDNLPPLEAFALGCPVVASDIPGAREQLGNAALFFNPIRPAEMAAQLAKVLNSEELRGSLVKSGLEKAAVLTPEDYMLRFFAVLDDFAPIRRSWRNDYSHG